MRSTAIDHLAQLIAHGLESGHTRTDLQEQTDKAIRAIFGERYPAKSPRGIRSAALKLEEDDVPYAGLVHQDSPDSGAYGGMSLAWFPISAEDARPACSLLTFVCGTRGLPPDEQVLGRPGHVRHLRALARYLEKHFAVSVWTKQDPTNLPDPIPKFIRTRWAGYSHVFNRYGNHIYAAAEVPQEPDRARGVVAGFLDFYAWERSWEPLKAAEEEVASLKNQLRAHLFPRLEREAVHNLLRERRFVIIQGPPGTGKTRLAKSILEQEFRGRGLPVQFHPAVTYETFVAGISPDVQHSQLRFQISPGWLVRAVREASQKDFLLFIDEINRADLSRVLGEAIYLLEAREINQGQSREIELPQPLPDGTTRLHIPKGLFILGTMNSADRSIAILDLAVRRRFAFVDLWPDLAVLEQSSRPFATEAFGQLQDIFAQYAPTDALVLLPGHAYFLADSDEELDHRLRFELIPLLNEYLQEGRLGPCESELRAYIDWLEGELTRHG